MDKSILKNLIGEELQIYPNDTYNKFGLIKEVDDTGVLFEIVSADPRSGYRPQDIVFISHSNKLTFKVSKE